jgi:hypothetical protein
MVWIDEHDRIVRPNDVQFGSDLFAALTGKKSGPFLAAVRAFARDGRGALPADDARAYQVLPTPAQQQARAEFAVACHLHRAGNNTAAETHFRRAGELAPGDWTIRRGSMPIRGVDPMMSDEFIALWNEGAPRYPAAPLPDE